MVPYSKTKKVIPKSRLEIYKRDDLDIDMDMKINTTKELDRII